MCAGGRSHGQGDAPCPRPRVSPAFSAMPLCEVAVRLLAQSIAAAPSRRSRRRVGAAAREELRVPFSISDTTRPRAPSWRGLFRAASLRLQGRAGHGVRRFRAVVSPPPAGHRLGVPAQATEQVGDALDPGRTGAVPGPARPRPTLRDIVLPVDRPRARCRATATAARGLRRGRARTRRFEVAHPAGDHRGAENQSAGGGGASVSLRAAMNFTTPAAPRRSNRPRA